jgi:hypothetical protein
LLYSACLAVNIAITESTNNTGFPFDTNPVMLLGHVWVSGNADRNEFGLFFYSRVVNMSAMLCACVYAHIKRKVNTGT